MTDSIFEKLAQKERGFLQTEFFAPVFSNKVRVKIDSVIVDFKVDPPTYRGWGIFKSTKKNAKLVREADIGEITAYLENFPSTHLIVCDNDRTPLGISANRDKFYTTNLTPFFLANNIGLFETVIVRFDGANFIFERLDYRSTLHAQQLRECLQSNISPDKLNISGVSKFQRVAYSLVHKLHNERKRLSTEERIRSAVVKGGGQFDGYRRLDGNISVTYSVDGQSYTSTVNENLGVISAGICLSGTDREHDLQSLMTVIKEGQECGLIYRF